MDRDYKNLLEGFQNEIGDNNPLSKEEQELTIISALTVLQAEDELKTHFKLALESGTTSEIIREVLYQLSPAVGLVKVNLALKVFNRISTDDSQHFTLPDNTYRIGLEFQKPLYGNEIKNLMVNLPTNASELLPSWLTKHFFGDFYSRNNLSVKDRERYLLAALITMNVDFQIKAHAMGSLKAGNSETELIWSALSLLPYIGFPLVINSIQKIHQANENEEKHV